MEELPGQLDEMRRLKQKETKSPDDGCASDRVRFQATFLHELEQIKRSQPLSSLLASINRCTIAMNVWCHTHLWHICEKEGQRFFPLLEHGESLDSRAASKVIWLQIQSFHQGEKVEGLLGLIAPHTRGHGSVVADKIRRWAICVHVHEQGQCGTPLLHVPTQLNGRAEEVLCALLAASLGSFFHLGGDRGTRARVKHKAERLRNSRRTSLAKGRCPAELHWPIR